MTPRCLAEYEHNYDIVIELPRIYIHSGHNSPSGYMYRKQFGRSRLLDVINDFQTG